MLFKKIKILSHLILCTNVNRKLNCILIIINESVQSITYIVLLKVYFVITQKRNIIQLNDDQENWDRSPPYSGNGNHFSSFTQLLPDNSDNFLSCISLL